MKKYFAYAVESGIVAIQFETKSISHLCRTMVNYHGAHANYEGWANDISLIWHVQLNGEELNVNQFVNKDNYHTFLNIN